MPSWDIRDAYNAAVVVILVAVLAAGFWAVSSGLNERYNARYTVAFLAPDGQPVRTFVAVHILRMNNGTVYATDVTGRTLTWTGGSIIEKITPAENTP